MKFRTCEEFVLDRLEQAENALAELLEDHHKVAKRNIELATDIYKLDDQVAELKCIVETFYKHIEASQYNSGDGYIFGMDMMFKDSDGWEEFNQAYERATIILNETEDDLAEIEREPNS